MYQFSFFSVLGPKLEGKGKLLKFITKVLNTSKLIGELDDFEA